jgi:hypothetical protein
MPISLTISFDNLILGLGRCPLWVISGHWGLPAHVGRPARTADEHAIEIGWRWDALVLFEPQNADETTLFYFPPMIIAQ